MRVTILFFLVAGILVLTIWVWRLTPARLEYFPLRNASHKHEQIDEINKLKDLESLRQHAINLLYYNDKEAIERDLTTLKASNLLALTVFIIIVVQIILFYEIAARGRGNKQQSR